MGEWMNGCMDGWKDGRIDGGKDGQKTFNLAEGHFLFKPSGSFHYFHGGGQLELQLETWKKLKVRS